VQNATIFTVNKIGKIDDYYVTKALQLYLEGLSYREIERIIGVSMSPAMGEIVQHQKAVARQLPPTYRFLTI
jgi:DNA-directed RNA polymerase specialized sigma24 family protein